MEKAGSDTARRLGASVRPVNADPYVESVRAQVLATALQEAIVSFSAGGSANDAAVRDRIVARCVPLARAIARGPAGELVAFHSLTQQIHIDSEVAGRAEARRDTERAAMGDDAAPFYDFENVRSGALSGRAAYRQLGERMTEVFAVPGLTLSQTAVWLDLTNTFDDLRPPTSGDAVPRHFVRVLADRYGEARKSEVGLTPKADRRLGSSAILGITTMAGELTAATYSVDYTAEAFLREFKAELAHRDFPAQREANLQRTLDHLRDALRDRVSAATEALAAAGLSGAVIVDFDARLPPDTAALQLVVEATPDNVAQIVEASRRAMSGAVEATTAEVVAATEEHGKHIGRAHAQAGFAASSYEISRAELGAATRIAELAARSSAELAETGAVAELLLSRARESSETQYEGYGEVPVLVLSTGERINILPVESGPARKMRLPSGTDADGRGRVGTISLDVVRPALTVGGQGLAEVAAAR